MLKKFEYKIAWRYLRSPRQGFVPIISLFSFLGILLGVATLIIVMAVMNGFRADLLDKLVGMRGHILVYGQDLTPQTAQTVRGIDAVSKVFGVNEKQAVIMAGGQASGVILYAADRNEWKDRPFLAHTLKSGKWQDLTESGSPAGAGNGNSPEMPAKMPRNVFIGSRLAERFNIKRGQSVQIMIPDGIVTAFGTMPSRETFTVKGFFEVGMSEFDKTFVFTDQAMLRDFAKMPQSYNHLEVFLEDPAKAVAVARVIGEKLGEGFAVKPWQHQDHAVFRAVEIEKNVMFVILTLIIIVAAFNIISGLTMLVKDKTRDIAIIRTIGAEKSSVLKIFMLCGATLGIGGAVLGTGAGIYIARNLEAVRRTLESWLGTNLFDAELYFLSKLPCKIIWSDVILVCITAIAITLLATYYPASRAARLNPVDALRM